MMSTVPLRARPLLCRIAVARYTRLALLATWELDEDELEELKKWAEYFGLDKTQNFEDYKRKYFRCG